MSIKKNEQDEDPRVTRTHKVVLQAALEVLSQAGYGAFTVDAVASQSGVARSTIYRHWPDKMDLIKDAMTSLNVQIEEDGKLEDSTPTKRVEALLNDLTKLMANSIFSDCLLAIIEASEHDRDVAVFFQEFNLTCRGSIVRAIEHGISLGHFSKELDSEIASLALAGPIIYQRLMSKKRFSEAQIRTLIKTVLNV